MTTKEEEKFSEYLIQKTGTTAINDIPDRGTTYYYDLPETYKCVTILADNIYASVAIGKELDIDFNKTLSGFSYFCKW